MFWEELKRARPERLLATRSLEVLQWHFHFALAEKRLWILTMQESSRIVAYAIFLRHDNPAFHLKRVRLVDFQALNENAPVLGPMLLWALSRCRQEGIHMLEAYGFRPRSRKCSMTCALRPGSAFLGFLLWDTEPELACATREPGNLGPLAFRWRRKHLSSWQASQRIHIQARLPDGFVLAAVSPYDCSRYRMDVTDATASL